MMVAVLAHLGAIVVVLLGMGDVKKHAKKPPPRSEEHTRMMSMQLHSYVSNTNIPSSIF